MNGWLIALLVLAGFGFWTLIVEVVPQTIWKMEEQEALDESR